jgi:subtilisin family serine protease
MVFSRDESAVPCHFVIMQGTTTEEVRITVVAIPKKYGDLLYALIDNKPSTKLAISGPVNHVTQIWEHLEKWSSGGPTTEGRIKPDVVAPGGYIKSAARVTTQQYENGDTCQETYMSGTSMASPLAAGSVALIRHLPMLLCSRYRIRPFGKCTRRPSPAFGQ